MKTEMLSAGSLKLNIYDTRLEAAGLKEVRRTVTAWFHGAAQAQQIIKEATL